MSRNLPKKLFNRKTLIVARALMGALLCRKVGNKTIKLPITEVEAYDGPEDKASHASRGKTMRNYPMFGEGGHWYLYFVYGNHWMLNIVTGPKDYPAAVLIRGAGDIKGPGRLTKFLTIGKDLNNKIANKKNGLWIEKSVTPIPKGQRVIIKKTPRIGVDYAGPIWAKKLYRFTL